MNPPHAPAYPHQLTTHNHTRHDPFYWLREKSNPAVLEYITAENDYTEAQMAHTQALQEELYQELLGRVEETDSEAPLKIGEYYYYKRTETGLQYPIYCRKMGSLDTAEQILLNPNELDVPFLQVGLYKVSPDHQWLAYALDTNGSERFTTYFKNLSTGELLAETLPNTAYDGEWGNNHTFFYVTPNEAWRFNRVWQHTLGQAVDQDRLVYEETNELFNVGLQKTKDRTYLMILCISMETIDELLLATAEENPHPLVIEPRRPGHRFIVEHNQGKLYILTNDQAINNRIMVTDITRPGQEHWQELLPHNPAVKIENLEMLADFLVLYERENGLKTIRVLHLPTHQTHHVAFDEPVYSYNPQWNVTYNAEFNSHILRFAYTSLTTPKTIYDYDLHQRTKTLVKQDPVRGGYNPADYHTERLWATAGDGARIPLSVVYHKSSPPSPHTPCWLYGYGSYGSCMEPTFQANRLSLLNRGWVYVIAHIRGGGEMGRPWYEQGKFLHKKNTFTDFVDSAQYLINKGYTSSDKLAISGRSAGGLLMGAVLNLAPHLFKAAIAGVPFVDVVTTMLDTSIPLTVPEFEEWGNPQDPTFYDYMLSYSPYDNVKDQPYPHLLVTSGLNDPRVQYWEPTKWVAKLRTLTNNPHQILLKTNMGAGHAGASGRYSALQETAFEYAFFLQALTL